MAYTTIDDPEAYFQVKAYSGSEGTDTISLDSDVMQPDMIWIKDRGTTAGHSLQDAVRGFNVANKLATYSTVGENDSEGATWENYGGVSAVATSSFTVVEGANTPSQANDGGDTYVAWCWKESATAGFDIVAYTGNGSATNISHSLSALPHLIIIKARDRSGPDWITFGDKIHTTPHDAIIKLNNTTALNTGLDSSWFNDTNPTTSVFTVGTQGDLNADGSTYITYLWTSIQGFSRLGSYTGGNDPFVYLGFRPAFILFKNAGATENWRIIDNKRDPHNPAVAHIYPNLNNAEGSGASYDDYCDFLSNGFKIRSGSGEVDGSGQTITYMAFAESPFVNSEGVPNNAR